MARPKSDIQPRILQAARARFLADGVDGASLRSIASDAGTSIGMVYYYYPTKDELFFGVVEEQYQGLLRDVEAAILPDVPVRERVERLYARVARLTDDEILLIRLILREALISNQRFTRLRERFMSGHIPLVARLVADGYAGGTFNPQLHPMVTMTCLAGVGVLPQLIRRALDGALPFPDAPSGEPLSKLLVSVLFTGAGNPARK